MTGGPGRLSLVGSYMRDLLAVFGVVVLAVCLGVTSAYLSVDLTPPGLELIRPPKAAVAAQLKLEARQNTIQADASECKYCVSVAELAQRFARHAKSARLQATALRETISLERQEVSRGNELLKAERSADGAEAAAAALTSWASRCKSEDFCRAPVRVVSSSCSSSAARSVTAAFSLVAAIKSASNGCASASCPSIDCKASAALRADTQYVERALAAAGGRVGKEASGNSARQLPVGASTLSAEITRVSDEAVYISKLLPLMLEGTSVAPSQAQIPKLASGMVDERALMASELATVMEHAAELSGNSKYDLRNEAALRLKSLAANLAQLGKETQTNDGVPMNWRAATESLGAALVDVARLQAMLDRSANASSAGTGCSGDAPTAAQQLREAMAMLDLCRMRSACTGRMNVTTGTGLTVSQIAARAETTAHRLIVQELGSSDFVNAAESEQGISAIETLRTQQGVCMKAAELREATLAAPSAAQAVAQGVLPVVQQSVLGPVAPQDLVTGAINSALAVSAPVAESEAQVVNAAAPGEEAASADDVIPAAAPAPSPTFTGNLLTPSAPTFVGSDGRPVSASGTGNR